uniref:EGF-like domain-containing protein n=1 Tax=Magallana gigas TaxID=29159 RepID=A0A8W8ILS0_MAGGI|nr:uncharacterized protein LOC105327082 isoform X2 [Crassostrea gigas]|eukprot:XP_011425680.1 PREDICTED: uncharacterized protein LOC105327082 isoform X2 [Crassostrea gigas]
MHSLKVLLCVVCLTIGFRKAQAALGGGTCTIPTVGGGPGATTVCTAAANGFCLIDHLTITGAVTGVTYDSVCVCYYGYSGPQCATADSTTTSTTSSSSNTNSAVAALALGGLGAYFLSQLGQGQSALGTGYGADTNAQEALYLQQAGLPIGMGK